MQISKQLTIFLLRCFLGASFIFVRLQAFCAFCGFLKKKIKKFKTALITSFILLLTIVINTHLALLEKNLDIS